MNKSTDKINLQLLAKLCAQKGMNHVVVSPGSRNAPLMVAFNRVADIQCHVIVDERSAGFFALGIAQQLNQPVGLICTSGTALLNYAPAIAEAYYLRIPLMILSADRPEEWIDQDDSQTIRQNNVFGAFVKGSYQLPVERAGYLDKWYVNRMVNEAVNRMISGRKGPVHLNIPLSEPLCEVCDISDEIPRVFSYMTPGDQLETRQLLELSDKINKSSKVLILASVNQPSALLQQALSQLSQLPQVVVMTESVANLKDDHFISCIDRTLARLPESESAAFFPEILISFGGPLISKILKGYLRQNPPCEHWYIGEGEEAIDTFFALTLQIGLDPKHFFTQLAPIARPLESDYAQRWTQLDQIADKAHDAYLKQATWSDLKAFSIIVPAIPAGSHLQLSNGTTVRYHQLFKGCKAQRVDANRGTSGIDGSTSTAAGAAVTFNGFTTLITGDISFLYDSNALWNDHLSSNLKIIVMNNGGGGIFRFIKGPSQLDELEEFFETPHSVEIHKLAAAYGCDYLLARNQQELVEGMDKLYRGDKPTILEVITPRKMNDIILKGYFK